MRKLELQALYAYIDRSPRDVLVERAHLISMVNEILKCWRALEYYSEQSTNDFYDDKGQRARDTLPIDLKDE